jgi:hypothetical protein
MIRLPNRGLALAALALLASTATAERNDPGSLLLYPEYVTGPGQFTLLTVTNTSGTEDVRVHFNFIDGEDCSKSNAFENLTPRDTLTVLSQTLSPTAGRGYAYAYALSATGQAVDFDHLIGSLITIDGWSNSEYAMNALVFEGKTGPGNPTDLDSDGLRDLDGQEYGKTPDRIAIPRFFGQLGMKSNDRAELVLIGLTGTQFDTTADFLIYNDNEEVFSAQHTFDCWDRVPLLAISGAFGQSFLLNATNHDPGEVLGFPAKETGWFVIDGGVANSSTTTVADPAFLAVMIELSRVSSASLPFTLGEQSNGQILSQSLSGN